ncbi:MAG: 4-(cytidine 5'-diphospho)-2-C-methyl-D-erythritol kinase [Dehalococcoidia bacterium]|nr:4-(cytidine 5'-diphospho)-2-C-methyl-D-erythritol kinase [Dehalococcoidia bacterium]
MSGAEPLVLPAYAKLNLTLEVLGRRPDGYHEVRSVLQTIDLHDTLTLEPASTLDLHCDRSELQGDDNLVLQAARLLQKMAGGSPGARITLHKRIPLAAGLGGGSSDAAAALLGLNRLWGLGLAAGDLAPLAAQLGSDVPFFLQGGTALVEGRGEVVVPLPSAPPRWFLLARPPLTIPNKTRTMYAALKPFMFSQGELTQALVDRLFRGDPSAAELLGNAFDLVAPAMYAGFDEFRLRLVELGLRVLHLAGAGPALFAPVEDEARGRALQRRLQGVGVEAYLVKAVSHGG